MKPFDRLKSLLPGKQEQSASFIGFRHMSGIGVRSKNYVMPLSRGASGFTRALSEDAVLTFIENSTPSSDQAQMKFVAETFLPQLARHRNTAGIFLIAVGDEPVGAQDVARQIQSLGTVCEYLVISDCADMEIATSLALGAAQELKNMALSGLDQIEPCDLTITYREEPANYLELVTLLEKSGFTVRAHHVHGSRAKYLVDAAMEGSHVILSFLGQDEYPTGTIITPVINVASDSQMHQMISSECDLQSDSTHEEILNVVSMAFGMVPTHTESVGVHERLFDTSVPLLKDEDGEGEICLVPAHPALIPFLIDLVSNQAGFFLRDWENLSMHTLRAKKILVIGTGGAEDRVDGVISDDARLQRLTVSQVGSLRALAETILSHN
jgi:hypothetical protein